MLTRFRHQIDDFWPGYVAQHADPTNRRLHFIGNTYLFIGLSAALARRSPGLAAFIIFSAYAVAWVGHFIFERNIPATLHHPILAGVCDMIMYRKMWLGEMEAETARYASH